jgi:regulation of enolase protein 1 (concanavalin A-like superfamily)
MTTISALPISFEWAVEPASREAVGDTLTITGGPETDLFIAPDGGYQSHDAPRLLGTVSGDFQFSARVGVEHRATYDAGALLLWADDRHWVKLAFELSVDGLARVVSVVTRGLSDDCDSFVLPGGHVWLRISRIGPAFALHASVEGGAWTFVRNFGLDLPAGDVAIGFSAQSPTGQGCTAVFDEIRFVTDTLADLRDGS